MSSIPRDDHHNYKVSHCWGRYTYKNFFFHFWIFLKNAVTDGCTSENWAESVIVWSYRIDKHVMQLSGSLFILTIHFTSLAADCLDGIFFSYFLRCGEFSQVHRIMIFVWRYSNKKSNLQQSIYARSKKKSWGCAHASQRHLNHGEGRKKS